MPTAYTQPVADGTITTFPQFAMLCARAFGALVDMREEPLDAPVPEHLSPSMFYAERYRDALIRLEELRSLAPDQAQRQCQQEYSQELARWRDRRDRIAVQRYRYQKMGTMVALWPEPTEDHAGLRKFMLDQLRESILFDCYYLDEDPMPTIRRWPDWLRSEIDAACAEIESAKSSCRDEVVRTEKRNFWLKQLRASLIGPL